jgi:hypothetical protein
MTDDIFLKIPPGTKGTYDAGRYHLSETDMAGSESLVKSIDSEVIYRTITVQNN